MISCFDTTIVRPNSEDWRDCEVELRLRITQLRITIITGGTHGTDVQMSVRSGQNISYICRPGPLCSTTYVTV